MMIRYKGFNIFAFSDTHGKHEEVQIPPDTDILICAGDVETDEYNFARFLEWYSNILHCCDSSYPETMICHLTYIRLLTFKNRYRAM